jgi:hypothetical protein
VRSVMRQRVRVGDESCFDGFQLHMLTGTFTCIW